MCDHYAALQSPFQVGVCVPSEVELKCPCVNPISSVQLLPRAVKSPLIKVSH